MQTAIQRRYLDTPRGREADDILRRCVHCGFCNATCPTYQLLGDELDGPRGRIYLVKQLLEGTPPNRDVMQHLDRCLTCRNCETTCPSGVEYARLMEVGRGLVGLAGRRGGWDSLRRRMLAAVIGNARLFAVLLGLGQAVRPLMPRVLKSRIPARTRPRLPRMQPARHRRRMIALKGCVEGALAPDTRRAAAVVLDRLGISLVETPDAGCCGALDLHTTDEARARRRARVLIDRWYEEIQAGAEAIVMTASGCGLTVHEYPRLFAEDDAYRDKARVIAEHTVDLSQVIDRELPEGHGVNNPGRRVAFHPPCTLQHGLRLAGAVEDILRRVGYHVVAIPDAHLCCGSAGSYSLLQPGISAALRARKLEALRRNDPEIICTANVGCQVHLGGAGGVPVRHWIELLV